ncbi:hypothetical protein SKAU_G00086040 [Synaphobranchus kaupii]|uniref:Uncharacterized protein n=1 Tax=Synaphobranchus kaupii TaxID=118154 RepID=A0A9Q1FVR1_SYNKA|nr:hypothetical protein SKAU_G00086040 [Synaphobranchus kaupii]
MKSGFSAETARGKGLQSTEVSKEELGVKPSVTYSRAGFRSGSACCQRFWSKAGAIRLSRGCPGRFRRSFQGRRVITGQTFKHFEEFKSQNMEFAPLRTGQIADAAREDEERPLRTLVSARLLNRNEAGLSMFTLLAGWFLTCSLQLHKGQNFPPVGAPRSDPAKPAGHRPEPGEPRRRLNKQVKQEYRRSRDSTAGMDP